MLGWSPAEFWRASTWDVSDAYEGYARKNGISTDNDDLTWDEVKEREREYEEWRISKNS